MLRLGTQTNSLVNHIYSRSTIGQPEVEVGMGCTLLSWTDRNPATIANIFEKGSYRYIEVTEDNYERTDKNGMSESQTYVYTTDPDGYRLTFRLRKDNPDGAWEGVRLNENNRYVKDSRRIMIGKREKYHDFTF